MATAAEREALASNFATRGTHAALYTTVPTSSAAGTEVSGGSPAYARRPITWTAGASDGTVTATVTFNVPSGTTIRGGGVHTALTGGSFLDGAALAEIPFTAQGTYILNLSFIVT